MNTLDHLKLRAVDRRLGPGHVGKLRPEAAAWSGGVMPPGFAQ